MTFTLERFSGTGIAVVHEALAELSAQALREFPYFWPGDPAQEERCAQRYLASPGSVAVVVRHGAQVVGAALGLPLAHEHRALRRPFAQQGYDLDRVFSCGVTALLPPYRARGLGGRLWREREAHARGHGFAQIALWTVERPGVPLPPAQPGSPGEAWQAHGFARHPELRAELSWQDLGEARETPKAITFWLKELT